MVVINDMHVRVFILFFWAMMSATLAHSHSDLLSLYPGAKVFHEEYKAYQHYRIIESDIRYINDFTGEADEGYAPHKTAGLEGKLHATVYDHTSSDSALAINKSMIAELQRKDFEIVFSCSKRGCGDVAGWKLFFSSHIEGDVEGQFYTVAKHPHKDGGNWFIAFYVNEFSGIPRSIIHTLEVNDATFYKYQIDTRQLAVKIASDDSALARIYFAFDSTEISPASNRSLEELVDKLRDKPKMKLAIFGHADRAGSSEYNQNLSYKRAEVVRRFLASRGVDLKSLHIEGRGEATAAFAGDGTDAQAEGRRVDVIASGD